MGSGVVNGTKEDEDVVCAFTELGRLQSSRNPRADRIVQLYGDINILQLEFRAERYPYDVS